MTLNESFRQKLINQELEKTKIAGKWTYKCVNVIDSGNKDGIPAFTIQIEKIYRGRVLATGENYITDDQISDTIETIKHCIF